MLSRIIIAVVIFFTGVYFGGQGMTIPFVQDYLSQKNETSIKSLDQTEGTTSLTIDFGDGTTNTFEEIAWSEGQSVFDALESVASTGDITLRAKDFGGDLGLFLETINSVPAEPSVDSWWQYWVNGEYGNIGASNYETSPGDVIEWKFTKDHLEE